MKRYRINKKKAARALFRAACVVVMAAALLCVEFWVLDTMPEHITTISEAQHVRNIEK